MEFSYFASVNIARATRWHKGGISEWEPQMWGLAMCGEAGECANALKKLKRLDMSIQQKAVSKKREDIVKDVAMEIGDEVVYCDLLAQRLGWTLEQCVIQTFNRISEREGFPERLSSSGDDWRP